MPCSAWKQKPDQALLLSDQRGSLDRLGYIFQTFDPHVQIRSSVSGHLQEAQLRFLLWIIWVDG